MQHIKKISYLFIKIIAVIIILYGLFIASLYAINPYIVKHQQKLEQIISEIVKQPLRVAKIRLGIYGIQPVIKFTNFELLNPANNAVQFKAQELDIGLDLLGSLYNLQLEPGIIFIKGTDLEVIKNADNTITVNNVTYSSQVQNQYLRDKLFWLISEGKVILKNINFAFKNENAEEIKVTNLNFVLANKFFYRKLKMQGSWQQELLTPTSFTVALRFHGSLLKHKPFSVYGNILLSHFNLVFAEKLQHNVDFLIPHEGRIKCYLEQSNITLDKIFRTPLEINNAHSSIIWHKSENSWNVELKNTAIENHELQIAGNAKAIIPFASRSPYLDINANFIGTHIENTKLYYPAKIMNSELVNWLDNAFVSGNEIKGKFIFQGQVADFPFDNNKGIFLVDTDLYGINFNYYKNWPIMSGINGKMVFQGRGLKVHVNSASIMNAPISNADAAIANLADASLNVNGTINSDSAIGLKFITKSPLKDIIGSSFEGITLSGPMHLDLKLMLPLTGEIFDKIKILGNISLQNNSLHLTAIKLGLEGLQGKISFTENEIHADNFSGELFAKPVAIKIATLTDVDANKITQVGLAGKVSLSDIEKSLQIKFANMLSGETDYAALFQFYPNNLKQNNNLHIESTLVGINVNFLEPLKKLANQRRDLTADLNFAAAKSKLNLVYGNVLKSSLIFNYAKDKLQLDSGEVHFGGGDLLGYDGSGLFLSGSLGKVNLSTWSDYWQKTKAENLSANIVRKINLDIADLIAFNQELAPAKIQGSYLDNALTLKIQSAKISGAVIIPDNYPRAPLNCNFDRIYISSAAKGTASKTTLMPDSMSALNFIAKELRYDDKNLGTVQIQTKPDDGNKNALIIKNLKISNSDFTLESSGKWSISNGQSQTSLDGKIKSNDFGKALRSWNMTQSLANGTGTIPFALRWPSVFFDPVLNGSSGNFSIAIKDGRIVNLGAKTNAEMGIGRVLNILGLQTLPRRLTLDFSDLVKEGYSFDTMQGSYKLNNGSVYTNDTILHGSVAEVNVSGRIGLRAQDFNMLMTVIPNITSSLPVLATVVGGPITGAVTWLADKVIISKGVGKVASYVYKITGSWVNPNISKL